MLDSSVYDLSKEAFQSVLERYQKEELENADVICRCYYYLAYSSEVFDEKISYLKMAENQIDKLSIENKKEISEQIYVSFVNNYFVQEEYENALPYYEKLTGDEPERAADKKTLADSYSMYGASLVSLEKAEAAEESRTYTYLALSCAEQEKQTADQILVRI